MKKIVYVFTVCSALLLFGCTEEKSSEETEPVTQVPVANEKGTEENSSLREEQTSTDGQSEQNETEKVITPKKAEEVVQNIVETAQEDQVVNDIKIDNSKDEVIANITFNEEVSDKERGSFLFNYMLFLEKQYPEQEVKINIEE
ncbi:lipoprotein NlpI [Solibacillus silvestris StLB046]|uniref:Lipoprotein NlpI n=1 Tax=Solibacillus silvestris (strain StLB046) TaxID=1002809 RepID=F2F3W8_SOLSS|nr:hypothetical protein [Solibacillus silvestris]BAK17766.1 lipoprotein NlpI [Solibacillus silvestris StLB046]